MVKKLFIYLFILFIIFLTSISVGHCKTFSYGLKYFDINNTRYPCIQGKKFIKKTDKYIKDTLKLINKDIDIKGRDAIKVLKLLKVGVCILPKGLTLNCGTDPETSDAIGCYYLFESKFWVIDGYGLYPIVHESLHHMILFLTRINKENLVMNTFHIHPIWLKYDVDLMREYRWRD